VAEARGLDRDRGEGAAQLVDHDRRERLTLEEVPRSLLTTIVASASPSRSSLTISSGRPAWITCSSTGRRSLTAPIFWFAIRMYGSSRTASIRSGSVIMYGDR